MSLSRKEVEHIALLARLDLSEEEIQRYAEQLSAILEHVAALQELETGHIPPTSSVLPLRSGLREDEPQPGLDTGRALQNAPQAEKDQFRVPPVLD
ncbi:MAG TPA: Asp-tRNA(Asn)/Glu-tRNA(Gln) amidotransferase subunit GatC [Anaerolineaceae bacterium]|jgi:aspartyl-tRNA(Asn)/glutamyl-tRNA(Gln) amidotransferase subunit C|nr:Asp-tRNA(Asn)/Glu-tRNA(Gln) amidotransferase subunit GatC [Anaerolineaceae bacterium]